MKEPSCQLCAHYLPLDLECEAPADVKPIWKESIDIEENCFTVHTWDWWQAALCQAYKPADSREVPP
jgi:hypothetical protein